MENNSFQYFSFNMYITYLQRSIHWAFCFYASLVDKSVCNYAILLHQRNKLSEPIVASFPHSHIASGCIQFTTTSVSTISFNDKTFIIVNDVDCAQSYLFIIELFRQTENNRQTKIDYDESEMRKCMVYSNAWDEIQWIYMKWRKHIIVWPTMLVAWSYKVIDTK